MHAIVPTAAASAGTWCPGCSDRTRSGPRRQAREGRAEVGGCIVPEFRDQRMAIERRLNDASLDAATAAVDQADLPEARGGGRTHEFVHHGWNIFRRERMKVELRFNRQRDRGVVVLFHHGAHPKPRFSRRSTAWRTSSQR